jgi:hypothetical protein
MYLQVPLALLPDTGSNFRRVPQSKPSPYQDRHVTVMLKVVTFHYGQSTGLDRFLGPFLPRFPALSRITSAWHRACAGSDRDEPFTVEESLCRKGVHPSGHPPL